jgi:hypothetical protein
LVPDDHLQHSRRAAGGGSNNWHCSINVLLLTFLLLLDLNLATNNTHAHNQIGGDHANRMADRDSAIWNKLLPLAGLHVIYVTHHMNHALLLYQTTNKLKSFQKK